MNWDLIEHFKLDAQVKAEYTLHTEYVSDHQRGIRKVIVEKRWFKMKHIGQGAFGEVWLEVRREGEKVTEERATKIIQKRPMAKVEIDYRRELLALAKLSKDEYNHLFVSLKCWFEDTDSVFLAMEYLRHGDLGNYINDGIAEDEARMIGAQLLDGLRMMHRLGFTHRDLKPQNIFVVSMGPDWWVKIGDFGISKRISLEQTALRTQTGTRQFQAPEIQGFVDEAEETSEYTNAVDIWSLGCVMHTILTGMAPFPSSRALRRYCSGMDQFPTSVLNEHGVSVDGCQFVQEILSPHPSDRPTAEIALKHPWLQLSSSSATGHGENKGNGQQVQVSESMIAQALEIDNNSTSQSVPCPDTAFNTIDRITPTDGQIGVVEKNRSISSLRTGTSTYQDLPRGEAVGKKKSQDLSEDDSVPHAVARFNIYAEQRPGSHREQPISRRANQGGNDVEESRKIRQQTSLFQGKLAEVDNKKRQTDRDTLLAVAQRNVATRMTAMDAVVFARKAEEPKASDPHPPQSGASTLKEEQLRREEEKLREIEAKVKREVNEKRQELLARESQLTEIEARMQREQSGDANNSRTSRVKTFFQKIRNSQVTEPISARVVSNQPEDSFSTVADPSVTSEEPALSRTKRRLAKRSPLSPVVGSSLQIGSNWFDTPPLRPVFGQSLGALFKRDGTAIPALVFQCIQAVDLYGLDTEGIYTMPRHYSIAQDVAELKESFDYDARAIDLRSPAAFSDDINIVAALLKDFLAFLPEPLLTSTLYPEFKKAAKSEEMWTRRGLVHAAVHSLPAPNYATLKALALHLHRVTQNANVNRANPWVLTYIFGPIVVGSGSGLREDKIQTTVMHTILDNTIHIFGPDE